ncbi:hypothetical protein VKT23_011947 [Stygiomarasmius scandens]|uniref:Uncharacterized protein n=1 Tax=Marasmiellus scandens TaxID=2682957 RepID=A0ABR1J7E5_9AGAR
MVKDDVCGKEIAERNDFVGAGGASHASDINLYSLPPGIHFPDSAQPSSRAYEKDLLGVFGDSLGSSCPQTSNTDSLLNLDDTSSIIGLKSTYADAVQTVQRTCGTELCADGSGVE